MTEPTHEVNLSQVLVILGAKVVELEMKNALIGQLQAELHKAREPQAPPEAKPENVVPINGDAA